MWLRDELEADDDPIGAFRWICNALLIEAVLVITAFMVWSVWRG